MHANGGCHCGYVCFEAEIDPEQVIVCHCTDCQTLSASAFRTVAFVPEASFSLKSGKLNTYVKVADSGNRREQTFCPHCGTHIYAAPAGETGSRTLGVRVGTLRQRARLRPRKQYYCRSALDWVMDLGSVEQVR
ncbi:MAG: GFA family protein [Gammaproteobacteria bacterium]|nr:GFA family protein [Gammaproteobacteria bacterium]